MPQNGTNNRRQPLAQPAGKASVLIGLFCALSLLLPVNLQPTAIRIRRAVRAIWVPGAIGIINAIRRVGIPVLPVRVRDRLRIIWISAQFSPVIALAVVKLGWISSIWIRRRVRAVLVPVRTVRIRDAIRIVRIPGSISIRG